MGDLGELDGAVLAVALAAEPDAAEVTGRRLEPPVAEAREVEREDGRQVREPHPAHRVALAVAPGWG